MISLPGWRTWFDAVANPTSSPALESLLKDHQQALPVLWLLGKAGAGKSSIVQRLTGNSRVQIGTGFEPCTLSALHYDHPLEKPVIRFLDTRGLGEANYDPAEDLAMARQGSHALLVVTRIDDVSQTPVLLALEELRGGATDLAILHVHTALHTLDGAARDRAIAHNQQNVESAVERKLSSVQIDFTEPDDGFDDPDHGLTQLTTALVDMVPELAGILNKQSADENEETLFVSVRKEILGYASASAAADVLPAVGLIAVPSIQGKMLHALAGRYNVSWDKRMAGEFVTALGSAFLYRYLISLGTRQLIKLIPVYGQSAGAAAAASISLASTYALGRVACLYFFRRNLGQAVDTELLRNAFVHAFNQTRQKSNPNPPEQDA